MNELESKTGEYKGYPTISFTKPTEGEEKNEHVFSGGLKKCKGLLEILADPKAIETIKKFIEDNKEK